MDSVLQFVPIDAGPTIGVCGHLVQVDGGQDAALVGQQRHLAARIGRFDPAQRRRWVAPVDLVEEDQAGVSRPPGRVDDPVE